MGDEADADWQDGLIEWGAEDVLRSIQDEMYRRIPKGPKLVKEMKVRDWSQRQRNPRKFP